MSGTSEIVMTEANAFKKAKQVAGSLGKEGEGLLHWLETGGPMLKLAAVSSKASELVHTYRYTRDVAAASGAGIALACYKHVRDEVAKFIELSAVERDLREVIELELRRSDAFVTEAGKWPKRSAVSSGIAQAEMTQERAALLQEWSKWMKGEGVTAEAKAAYAQLLARINPSDPGWAAIAEIALDRAKRVKREFPSITRATYEQNEVAKKLVEVAYTSHGKGEMFEHAARNSEAVKNAAAGELRAATHIAAARGTECKSTLSAGELRLGTVNKDGEVTHWKKFADSGVLITTDRPEAAVTSGAAAKVKVDGIAQATALFEFKAEAKISDIPNQQERALPRMIERWEKREPVYVAFNVIDESGKPTEKVYLLQPPDSKAGLSYYGVGTSNAFIEDREILATQGALTRNINVDISNDSMRWLWTELFWTAFEAL